MTPTFTLKFAFNGAAADPDTYTDLAKARDVAFGIAQELELDVNIFERFGQSENLIEIIEG